MRKLLITNTREVQNWDIRVIYSIAEDNTSTKCVVSSRIRVVRHDDKGIPLEKDNSLKTQCELGVFQTH